MDLRNKCVEISTTTLSPSPPGEGVYHSQSTNSPDIITWRKPPRHLSPSRSIYTRSHIHAWHPLLFFTPSICYCYPTITDSGMSPSKPSYQHPLSDLLTDGYDARPPPDVQIRTSAGLRIPVHSTILVQPHFPPILIISSSFDCWDLLFQYFYCKVVVYDVICGFFCDGKAMASDVLEKMIDRPSKHRTSETVIPILGVPCAAVCAFVRFLYTSR